MPLPSQESKWLCICVLRVLILPRSIIDQLYFGTVLTVWYFVTVPTVWYFGTVPTVWYFGTVPTMWYFGTVPTVWYFGTVPTVWYLYFSFYYCNNVQEVIYDSPCGN